MPERDWSPERVRRNFRIDLFSAVCAGIYVSIIGTFLPVVVRRMGGSSMEVALVVAGPFIGHLLSPVFAYLLSGFHPVRVIAGTVAVARLVFVVGLLVTTTPLMLAATSVAAWIVSIANVAAYTTLMAGIYPEGERAQAMSRVRIGFALSGIAAAALAGTVIDVVPATLVFALAALLSLPGPLGFLAIRHEGAAAAEPRRPVGSIVRDAWSDRQYRSFMASVMVFGAGNLMNAGIVPILLVDHFDAPSHYLGISAGLQSATMLLAFFFLGRRIDRGSSLRTHLRSVTLVLLVPLCFLMAPGVWWLLPTALLSGVALAVGDVTYHTNIVQLAPPRRVGEYAALQSFLLGVRGTAAPFAASLLLVIASPHAVLVLGFGLMLAGFALMARAVREPQPARAPAAATTGSPAEA
jgi:MFS family permease